jgi:farnesyl-diphosphate farnesyltransferase
LRRKEFILGKMPGPRIASPGDLLRATSRSFYLTLRVLPAPVRPQIGLAYLLARATDTIADTEILPAARRLGALRQLRERILGQGSEPLDFGEFARHQTLSAEKLLLEKAGDSLAALQTLSPEDLKRARDVLATIISGQELDLRRFGNSSATEDSPVGPKIIALETEAELDDYTYRVAGCVGEFWTRMCRAHLFPKARLDENQLIADGVRFGKGLQLVNILRDLPADLKKGRCYLPMEKLEPAKLFPEILLSPATEERFLPLFRGCLDEAEAHLAAGWRYTNTLPFAQMRVRLACAWPILIGMRTIEKLRAANVIDLRRHVKISHGERNGILLRSILACPLPFAWRRLFPMVRKAVASGGELA